jgi:hypothetical protein
LMRCCATSLTNKNSGAVYEQGFGLTTSASAYCPSHRCSDLSSGLRYHGGLQMGSVCFLIWRKGRVSLHNCKRWCELPGLSLMLGLVILMPPLPFHRIDSA